MIGDVAALGGWIASHVVLMVDVNVADVWSVAIGISYASTCDGSLHFLPHVFNCGYVCWRCFYQCGVGNNTEKGGESVLSVQ